jgi:hypothetical protein
MRHPTVRCALLAVLVADHVWGRTLPDEQLLRRAALEPEEFPLARDAIDSLRTHQAILSADNRGIGLDTSHFGMLAEILYNECNWDPAAIRLRLKHYEGWDRHDWA